MDGQNNGTKSSVSKSVFDHFSDTKSSVSESFFDKFSEYTWTKCNRSGNSSNQYKTQFKKKRKHVPPLFVGNSEFTTPDWNDTNNFGAWFKSLSESEVTELSGALSEVKFKQRDSSSLTDAYKNRKKKTAPPLFVGNSKVTSVNWNKNNVTFGAWQKSVTASDTTNLSSAFSLVKIEQQEDNSSINNSFQNSIGCVAVGVQTDTSQEELDSDSPSLLTSCNISNMTALDSLVLKKLKDNTRKTNFIVDDAEIALHSSRPKNGILLPKKRSRSQPAITNSFKHGSEKSSKLLNTPSPANNQNSGKKRQKCKGEDKFEGLIEYEDAMQGLRDNVLIKGELRINPKNYTEAYITHPTDSQDVLIVGVADRNRALEGDVIVVEIKEQDKWRKLQNGSVQKTGKVVYITELVHTRSLIGLIQKYDNNFTVLRPRDCRLPKLLVAVTTLPDYLRNNLEDYEDVYFKAQIICWNSPKFAQGLIECIIGKKGEISGETEAIFREWDLDSAPVPESFNKYLPPIPYNISQEEINNRLDLRKETIFTIDPETARDLDDAVSIKKISSETYEVGVHISDVSYFLTEGTPLDEKVSDRATTIYMVDRVNHMLPVQLCLLCSLLPGEDKLAFSVIWHMDQKGNISNKKFRRTIINSCAQLSYGHAQDIIDAKEPEDLPPIYNGKTVRDIKECILALYNISKNLTAKRFAGGALRIDQPKVSFKLDSDHLPCDAYLYALRDSNRLIEEFMLLANQSVAEYIYKKYPKASLLRRHPPPKEEMITKLETSLNKLGIFIERSSSGDLHNSLQKYTEGDPARAIVLNCLCSKAMSRAVYFCYEEDTHHYALNIDMYTHFTSPIRRYVDIVVHRILAAAIGYSALPALCTDKVRKYARNSNQKKYAAKRAGEASSDLFTSLYVRKLGTLEVEAVVFNINCNSLDTVVISLALKIRVYIDDLEGADVEYNENDIASSLHIRWKYLGRTQVVQMFSVVRLLLKTQQSTLQCEAQLLPTTPTISDLSAPPYHNALQHEKVLPFG